MMTLKHVHSFFAVGAGMDCGLVCNDEFTEHWRRFNVKVYLGPWVWNIYWDGKHKEVTP